jgi:Leucine-rich repeat (LRR) protein
VSVSLVDGIEYITAVEVGVTDFTFVAAGLNLRRLPPLLRQLPGLKSFECSNCNRASKGPNKILNPLPATLPAIAPNLTKLGLTACDLIGTLPRTYGDWLGLQELFMFGNSLTGSLPAEFVKLRRLQVLELGGNKLSGE